MRKRPIISHPDDPSLALVPLTRGHFAIISIVDARSVGLHNWAAKPERHTVYAVSKKPHGPGYLHVFVGHLMGLTLANTVDHRNGNGLDCRRSNLRDATVTEQRRNQRPRSGSLSGVKGVSWDAANQRWMAKIGLPGKQLNLGRFDSIQEAAEAYRRASVIHFGDFALSRSRVVS